MPNARKRIGRIIHASRYHSLHDFPDSQDRRLVQHNDESWSEANRLILILNAIICRDFLDAAKIFVFRYRITKIWDYDIFEAAIVAGLTPSLSAISLAIFAPNQTPPVLPNLLGDGGTPNSSAVFAILRFVMPSNSQ